MPGPPDEPNSARGESADELQLLLAYRRCHPRRQRILRYLANYFSSVGPGHLDAENIVPLVRERTD